MHTKEEKTASFGRLLDILDNLRVKCPWDAKQTNESLRPNTIEETYELCDALMSDDVNNIKKELGERIVARLLLFKNSTRERAVRHGRRVQRIM